MFVTIGLFAGRQQALIWYALAPFAVLVAVLVAPALLRSGLPSRSARVARWVAQARGAAARVRHGLVVFRRAAARRSPPPARSSAPGRLQWVACYVLLVALNLDGAADLGAAAAVLFAVNVTAVLPVTPVQPRRLPGRLRGGADRRLRDPRRAGARLRDHPAGGRDRHRGRDGRPGAASRRASPGARCACARCTPRRSRSAPARRRGVAAGRARTASSRSTVRWGPHAPTLIAFLALLVRSPSRLPRAPRSATSTAPT